MDGSAINEPVIQHVQMTRTHGQRVELEISFVMYGDGHILEP